MAAESTNASVRGRASHITWVGEFRAPDLERNFAESSLSRSRDAARLCIVATTLTSLAFAPLDLVLVPPERLAFFLGDRLVIAVLGLLATLAVGRAAGLDRLLAVTYGQQVAFFALNALIFNHPALLRHGGMLIPLIPITLLICLPGSFRAAAALCAFAPIVSLLSWGVLRPDPEAPLDLAIVAMMMLAAYMVGAVARAQLSRMRREEYLHNQILREAKDAAEAGSRAKADFLAVMSHEIRTPINGVLGMLHLVLDSALPAQERHRVETARQSAEGLLTILDDILDFTRLETGRIEYENEPFALRRTIADVSALMSARAREKGLKFSLNLTPGLPEWVCGDSARLRQILFNLIGNAVKFTETGGVTVDALAGPATDGRIGVEIAVVDTGIGIDADQQPRLFQAFSQADASINRRFGGTGLGLAISRKLAEGMGGAIRFDSTPGQGSRFRVLLAFAPATPAASAPVPAPASMRPLSVLLAEDNPVNSEVAQAFLHKAGHTVTLAVNGAEAVDLARRGGFDLILMDMRMPKMDGLEATRRIRALPPPQGTAPIIALTANAMRSDIERCLDAGMDAHMAKPLTPSALYDAISRVLARRDGAQALPAHCFDVLAAGDCGGLEEQLRRLGHRVFAVSDGAALTMLAARPFDLVVVGNAGAEKIAALHRAAADHPLPPRLVAIADASHATALTGAGADEVLTAPIAGDTAESIITGLAAGNAPDVAAILGEERTTQLRGLLMDNLRQQMQTLRSSPLDTETLSQLAHRIKGSAATLGLHELAAAADRVLQTVEGGMAPAEALDGARHDLYTAIDGLIVAASGLPSSNG